MVWNYFLMIPLIFDLVSPPTMTKFFSHYVSSSRNSSSDNTSSGRGGGEVCFRHLLSAEESYQHRQMEPMSRRNGARRMYTVVTTEEPIGPAAAMCYSKKG